MSNTMRPYDYIIEMHKLDATVTVETEGDDYILRITLGKQSLPETLTNEVFQNGDAIIDSMLRLAEVKDRIENAKQKIERESPGRIDWELSNEEISRAENELETVIYDFINGDCTIEMVAIYFRAYIKLHEKQLAPDSGELKDLIAIFD